MKLKVIITILMLMLAISSEIQSEDIKTTLSKNKVHMNELITLIYTSPKRIYQRPDFTPLLEDFEIISSSSSFQTSIVNGRIQEESQFLLKLMPKHEGEFLLPPIRFGDLVSNEEKIFVTQAEMPTKEDDLYITTEINAKDEAYPDVPLIYTVRLYTSLDGIQGTLSDLQVSDPDAIVKRFKEDRQYEMFDQTGKKRLVIERQYSVVPSKDGELQFYPVIFEGSVQVGIPTFFNTQMEYRKVYSNQEKVVVKKIPEEFRKGVWFSANALKFQEKWSKDFSEVIMGEPLTWTLLLEADGNFGEAIPNINLKTDRSIKTYVDKERIDLITHSEGFTGIKEIKMDLIASKEGEYIIPEVKILWWNLKNKTLHETIIPEKKLIVKSQSIIDDELLSLNQKVETEENRVVFKDFQESEKKVFLENQEGFTSTHKQSVFAFFIFFTIAIVSYACYQFSDRGFEDQTSLKDKQQKLKQACLQDDPKASEIHLIEYLKGLFDNEEIRNLMDVKSILPNELVREIERLYQALYSENKSWEGKTLWNAIESFKYKKKNKKNRNETKILRNLY